MMTVQKKKRKYFPFRSRVFFFILLISHPYLAVNSMRARDEKRKKNAKKRRKTKLALCGCAKVTYTGSYRNIWPSSLRLLYFQDFQNINSIIYFSKTNFIYVRYSSSISTAIAHHTLLVSKAIFEFQKGEKSSSKGGK